MLIELIAHIAIPGLHFQNHAINICIHVHGEKVGPQSFLRDPVKYITSWHVGGAADEYSCQSPIEVGSSKTSEAGIGKIGDKSKGQLLWAS